MEIALDIMMFECSELGNHVCISQHAAVSPQRVQWTRQSGLNVQKLRCISSLVIVSERWPTLKGS